MYRNISKILRNTRNPAVHPSKLIQSRPLSVEALSSSVREFVEDNARICRPKDIYVCDGTQKENQKLIGELVEQGRLRHLPKYVNCYSACSSEADVARVESQTYMCSERQEDTIPTPKEGIKSTLGNWKAPSEMDEEQTKKFTGSMKGRTMYVIPFSMGPIGSPLAKIGIQLTDSAYVVASMRIMTRMGKKVLDRLNDGEFVKCVHSVGSPLEPGEEDKPWPCNPKQLVISHFPQRNEIKSYGSGYGGNSLLGKKCFALRIASCLAHKEGWMAEHMLILGITNPQGVKKYIAAAFPSQCGKTNLAMITPTLPGWKAECVGDDIAWMKFDDNGRLRAINPEYGFFGVAPGTNNSTNPNAMASIFKDTIFTNVAHTSDGGVYWEGLEEPPSDVKITSWLNETNWKELNKTAAHSNSRFCSPVENCPIIDPCWEDPEGVPIDAILFGGRRPKTIPLVYEAFSWPHAVFMGASMRSEATSAAEFKGKALLHDPFAMRPFFGYNFAQYMQHWLNFEKQPHLQLPKVFHVNWFRKEGKKFLWPGFGENSRVLDWIFRRCDGEDIAQPSVIGLIPKPGSLNLAGIDGYYDMEALFRMPKDELQAEADAIQKYFDEQLPGQVPKPVIDQLDAFQERISKL